jgi:hypothetical protein
LRTDQVHHKGHRRSRYSPVNVEERNLQQRVENRGARSFLSHRAAKRLIQVDGVVVVEHEDDDHAALVGGIVSFRRWRRPMLADIQFANRHRLRNRASNPERDLVGAAGRTPFFFGPRPRERHPARHFLRALADADDFLRAFEHGFHLQA